MEAHVLKALYKLAKDIIEGGPGAQIRLDESLFQDSDTNQISLTLKNYKRPNGVATQIFNVDLVNYQGSLDDKNLVVATRFSSNYRDSFLHVPYSQEETPNKNISALQVKGGSTLSLAPTKLISNGTGEPAVNVDAVAFDSAGPVSKKNPNLGFLMGASKNNSPSPPNNKRVPSLQLENVPEEEN